MKTFKDCLQELDVSLLETPCPKCNTTHPRYIIRGSGFAENPAMILFLLEATLPGKRTLRQPAVIEGDKIIHPEQDRVYGTIHDLKDHACEKKGK